MNLSKTCVLIQNLDPSALDLALAHQPIIVLDAHILLSLGALRKVVHAFHDLDEAGAAQAVLAAEDDSQLLASFFDLGAILYLGGVGAVCQFCHGNEG